MSVLHTPRTQILAPQEQISDSTVTPGLKSLGGREKIKSRELTQHDSLMIANADSLFGNSSQKKSPQKPTEAPTTTITGPTEIKLQIQPRKEQPNSNLPQKREMMFIESQQDQLGDPKMVYLQKLQQSTHQGGLYQLSNLARQLQSLQVSENQNPPADIPQVINGDLQSFALNSPANNYNECVQLELARSQFCGDSTQFDQIAQNSNQNEKQQILQPSMMRKMTVQKQENIFSREMNRRSMPENTKIDPFLNSTRAHSRNSQIADRKLIQQFLEQRGGVQQLVGSNQGQLKSSQLANPKRGHFGGKDVQSSNLRAVTTELITHQGRRTLTKASENNQKANHKQQQRQLLNHSHGGNGNNARIRTRTSPSPRQLIQQYQAYQSQYQYCPPTDDTNNWQQSELSSKVNNSSKPAGCDNKNQSSILSSNRGAGARAARNQTIRIPNVEQLLVSPPVEFEPNYSQMKPISVPQTTKHVRQKTQLTPLRNKLMANKRHIEQDLFSRANQKTKSQRNGFQREKYLTLKNSNDGSFPVDNSNLLNISRQNYNYQRNQHLFRTVQVQQEQNQPNQNNLGQSNKTQMREFMTGRDFLGPQNQRGMQKQLYNQDSLFQIEQSLIQNENAFRAQKKANESNFRANQERQPVWKKGPSQTEESNSKFKEQLKQNSTQSQGSQIDKDDSLVHKKSIISCDDKEKVGKGEAIKILQGESKGELFEKSFSLCNEIQDSPPLRLQANLQSPPKKLSKQQNVNENEENVASFQDYPQDTLRGKTSGMTFKKQQIQKGNEKKLANQKGITSGDMPTELRQEFRKINLISNQLQIKDSEDHLNSLFSVGQHDLGENNDKDDLLGVQQHFNLMLSQEDQLMNSSKESQGLLTQNVLDFLGRQKNNQIQHHLGQIRAQSQLENYRNMGNIPEIISNKSDLFSSRKTSHFGTSRRQSIDNNHIVQNLNSMQKSSHFGVNIAVLPQNQQNSRENTAFSEAGNPQVLRRDPIAPMSRRDSIHRRQNERTFLSTREKRANTSLGFHHSSKHSDEERLTQDLPQSILKNKQIANFDRQYLRNLAQNVTKGFRQRVVGEKLSSKTKSTAVNQTLKVKSLQPKNRLFGKTIIPVAQVQRRMQHQSLIESFQSRGSQITHDNGLLAIDGDIFDSDYPPTRSLVNNLNSSVVRPQDQKKYPMQKYLYERARIPGINCPQTQQQKFEQISPSNQFRSVMSQDSIFGVDDHNKNHNQSSEMELKEVKKSKKSVILKQMEPKPVIIVQRPSPLLLKEKISMQKNQNSSFHKNLASNVEITVTSPKHLKHSLLTAVQNENQSIQQNDRVDSNSPKNAMISVQQDIVAPDDHFDSYSPLLHTSNQGSMAILDSVQNNQQTNLISRNQKNIIGKSKHVKRQQPEQQQMIRGVSGKNTNGQFQVSQSNQTKMNGGKAGGQCEMRRNVLSSQVGGDNHHVVATADKDKNMNDRQCDSGVGEFERQQRGIDNGNLQMQINQNDSLVLVDQYPNRFNKQSSTVQQQSLDFENQTKLTDPQQYHRAKQTYPKDNDRQFQGENVVVFDAQPYEKPYNHRFKNQRPSTTINKALTVKRNDLILLQEQLPQDRTTNQQQISSKNEQHQVAPNDQTFKGGELQQRMIQGGCAGPVTHESSGYLETNPFGQDKSRQEEILTLIESKYNSTQDQEAMKDAENTNQSHRPSYSSSHSASPRQNVSNSKIGQESVAGRRMRGGNQESQKVGLEKQSYEQTEQAQLAEIATIGDHESVPLNNSGQKIMISKTIQESLSTPPQGDDPYHQQFGEPASQNTFLDQKQEISGSLRESPSIKVSKTSSFVFKGSQNYLALNPAQLQQRQHLLDAFGQTNSSGRLPEVIKFQNDQRELLLNEQSKLFSSTFKRGENFQDKRQGLQNADINPFIMNINQLCQNQNEQQLETFGSNQDSSGIQNFQKSNELGTQRQNQHPVWIDQGQKMKIQSQFVKSPIMKNTIDRQLQQKGSRIVQTDQLSRGVVAYKKQLQMRNLQQSPVVLENPANFETYHTIDTKQNRAVILPHSQNQQGILKAASLGHKKTFATLDSTKIRGREDYLQDPNLVRQAMHVLRRQSQDQQGLMTIQHYQPQQQMDSRFKNVENQQDEGEAQNRSSAAVNGSVSDQILLQNFATQTQAVAAACQASFSTNDHNTRDKNNFGGSDGVGQQTGAQLSSSYHVPSSPLANNTNIISTTNSNGIRQHNEVVKNQDILNLGGQLGCGVGVSAGFVVQSPGGIQVRQSKLSHQRFEQNRLSKISQPNSIQFAQDSQHTNHHDDIRSSFEAQKVEQDLQSANNQKSVIMAGKEKQTTLSITSLVSKQQEIGEQRELMMATIRISDQCKEELHHAKDRKDSTIQEQDDSHRQKPNDTSK